MVLGSDLPDSLRSRWVGEINEVPVNELQVHPIAGKKFGCLSQLDDAELSWLAAELTQILGLRRRDDVGPPPLQDADGRAVGRPGGRILVEQWPKGLRVQVPPRGARHYIGGLLGGLLFTCVGLGTGIGACYFYDVGKADLEALFFFGLFSVLFCTFGLCWFVISLICTRRQFRIDVDGGELRILRSDPFGSREFRWKRDELKSIEVAESGTWVNGKSLSQVRFQPAEGAALAIMTGQGEADLSLVATATRDALGLAPLARGG